MVRSAAILAAAALGLLTTAAFPQTPTFHAGIDLVRVGVTVVDHDGHPVTGLSPEDFSFAETIKLLEASDVTVYAIGVLDHESPSLRQPQRAVLQQIAGTTGGRAFFPASVRQLDEVYNQVLQEIHGQYSLGYVSTNGRMDGTWRKVRIRVVRRGLTGATVRTRDGYYALYMPPKPRGG